MRNPAGGKWVGNSMASHLLSHRGVRVNGAVLSGSDSTHGSTYVSRIDKNEFTYTSTTFTAIEISLLWFRVNSFMVKLLSTGGR